jgi:hypothetical protein
VRRRGDAVRRAGLPDSGILRGWRSLVRIDTDPLREELDHLARTVLATFGANAYEQAGIRAAVVAK